VEQPPAPPGLSLFYGRICQYFARRAKISQKLFHFYFYISYSYTQEVIMAKRTPAQRRRLARKKCREFKAAVRGEGKRLKVRNPMVVALILRNGSGSHGDARKAANKVACRKKVREDE
jgi:hypothetical protein